MKETVRQAADRVLAGGLISREEALELSRQPLEAEQMTEFIRRSMEIVDIAAQM